MNGFERGVVEHGVCRRDDAEGLDGAVFIDDGAEDDCAVEVRFLGVFGIDGGLEVFALAGDDAGADAYGGSCLILVGWGARRGEHLEGVTARGQGGGLSGPVGNFNLVGLGGVSRAGDGEDDGLHSGRLLRGRRGGGLGRDYLLAEGEGGGAGCSDEGDGEGGGDEAGGASEFDGAAGQVHDSPLEVREGVGIEDADGVGSGCGVGLSSELGGEAEERAGVALRAGYSAGGQGVAD